MSKLHKAQTQQGHSKHFFEFIRTIGEAKSKQEEDKVVANDITNLKNAMGVKSIKPKEMKECVVRMYYSEMLGHSAEFGHIHAVNLASNADLFYKRTGYLATWLCVNPEHEFMYLIVANMQRDMKSDNFLDVSAALTAAAKMLRPELMSAINNDIVGLLTHSNALVRRKVVVCMHAFYRKSDGVVGDTKNFRTALCDRDPSVMGTSLNIFHELALTDPTGLYDVLPSFVSILKQITEHRLSREFDYHRVPAPWFQIKLLRIIGIIAADDPERTNSVAETVLETMKRTNSVAETVLETMKRADSGLNIGHAVIFEAINTITTIYPNSELIEAAAEAIGKFLSSNNSNMKYLGITALSRIVKIDPKYAAEHQGVVIGCLEDSDETIRRKTLTLLFAMCNEDNVEAIVDRLLRFLTESTDRFLRGELVRNVCDLAERFSPSNEWYVSIMNKLLEYGAEHVTQTTIQGMLKTIAEGEGEDEAEDAQFRTQCVENYFKMVENPDKLLPPPLYQVVAWTIGEYGFLTKKISRAMMIDRLCDLLERVPDSETRGWVLTALMKLVAHNNALPDNVEDIVAKMKDSRSVSLQQRSYEFDILLKMPQVLKKVQPLDGCCEDIEVDEGLSFLDNIVQSALAQGAKPRREREKKEAAANGGLRMSEYETTRTDVVNEDNLDAKKFEEEEETLQIKSGVSRWGEKNLAEEAAVEQPIESIPDESGENKGDGETAPASGGDPMAGMEVTERKTKTKNEKFFDDILGGGGKGKKKGGAKKRGAARAAEAAKRAAEAEEATAHLADEGEQEGTSAAPSTANHTDPMAGLGAPATTTAGPSTSPGTSPTSQNPPSSGAPAKVDVRIEKQQGPDAVLYRVGFLAAEPVQKVMVTFTAPAVCKVQCRTQIKGAEVRGNQCRIEELPAKQPAFIEVMMIAGDFPQGGGMKVEATYSSAGGNGTATGGIALGLSDLLRPTSASQEDFGKAWKAPEHMAGEFKVQLKFPVQLTPDVLGKHLMEKANIKLLHVIGRECIAAAKVVQAGHLVLCHVAVEGNNANTSVRCKSKEFAQAVGQTLLGGL